ncbi:valine--tRNA ligase [archaeon]|mgnify:CR=1 FL=1|jgi:valyl-tRNA synthetase|nr:valine--tRNA ligase [archaeon]MBT4022728.1 valine--tRNA ligase [archaeon]MBT4273078.1 valine--tRNA ligase [archaeon]MBT4461059.1 valine--tRNA ligase [archaeon]MBT4858728.1 valine--tRNA ligase [archaeon]
MELPSKYDSKISEPKWQKYWEDNKIYEFDINDKKKEVFSVDTPPPTISGKMHIGHAFSYSQQDFVIRYQRMKGKNVFYPFGTDDNGLPTEKLVQKHKKVNLRKIPRDEAIRICLEYLEEERPKFIQDWKNIGMSCDFNLKYSTIDDHSRKTSQKTFLELIKKGLAYRKEGPIMWDRVFQSAIAQAELEDKKLSSNLVYIKARFEDSKDTYLLYATTRPEMLFGCVGMSVEEKGDYVTLKIDNEYYVTGKKTYEEKFKDLNYELEGELKGKDLIGKKVIIPISNNLVEIDHDISVAADYGTGVVYFCTYGGIECVEWMTRRPKCEPINILNKNGTLNEKNKSYEGLLTTEARKKITEDLEKQGHVIKKEKIEHIVNVGERSGAEVEYIVSKQWYIKYLDQKEEFLVAGSKLKWHPVHMKHRLENWIKGLNWDWSISRQRHYGVPIPVWYDKSGKMYFADESQLPVDPTKDRPKGVSKDLELIPEHDVFDTWFTSGSTPFISTGLMPKDVQKRLFPMSLRPQSHDIINFWLFYTLAKTQLLHKTNPWENVTISGWALDPHGRKMSKSKGNVISPQVMIEKFSADALRYWSSGSKLGDDMPFQEKDLLTGNKTVTKLWNASKFALMHLKDYNFDKHELEVMDKWALTKLQKLIKSATESFEKYEYSKAKHETDIFFWQIFCDNYLEIVKDRLYNPENYHKGARESAQFGLYEIVLNILKLFAPIMPYITEEIYQLYFAKKDKSRSIHISNWPSYNKNYVNEDSEKTGDLLVQILSHVRKFKSENSLSLKEELSLLIIKCNDDERKLLETVILDLKSVTKSKDIEFGKSDNLEVEIKK